MNRFQPLVHDNSPTHEYIDCEIVNNSTTDLSPMPVVFNNVKTSQIIDNCSDYYLSVIRWSLDSGLPQIIPQIKLGSEGGTNVNQTAYVVNIGYSKLVTGGAITFLDEPGVSVATPVEFVPEDLTLPQPANNPVGQDEVYTNPYYFIHSIGNFLSMVNKAIDHAVSAFVVAYNAKYPTTPITLPTLGVPHFDWNGSVITASVGDLWRYNSSGAINFYISFNTPLHNLFDTFPYKFINKTVAANNLGQNYVMLFHDQQWESTYTAGDPLTTYYVYNQEGSSVPSWSPVQSIVFQTSTIPINPSKTGAPTYTGENLKDSIQASGISNILTDFQIPLDRGDEMTNSVLYYASSGEYRLFNLMSNGGLLNLNIQIYWKDRLGFIHPFLMKNGSSGSLKILLRKKTFNGI